LKRKIKVATPNINGTKNQGKFFGFPDENIESFEVFGFTPYLGKLNIYTFFKFFITIIPKN